MADEPQRPEMPRDDDIRARFEKIREDLKGMELPELPDDEGLREKIERVTNPAGSYKMPDPPEIELKRPKTATSDGSRGNYNYKTLGIGMSAAYSLIGSMIVGFGLGWLFDRATHSNYGQVIGAVAGSILGIVTAIVLINRDGGGGK
jgi:F0F1-type ATP synthase assembly protein I